MTHTCPYQQAMDEFLMYLYTQHTVARSNERRLRTDLEARTCEWQAMKAKYELLCDHVRYFQRLYNHAFWTDNPKEA